MHVVKIHVAIMQIPHIDKVPHKAAASILARIP